MALAGPSYVETCKIDGAALQARIAVLEADYALVLSDISCDAPTLPAHRLIFASAKAADATLWTMGRLDTLAWVYAHENATGVKADPAGPPLDTGFVQARDACTDVACLCAVLIDHTNSSLGGTSPYQ